MVTQAELIVAPKEVERSEINALRSDLRRIEEAARASANEIHFAALQTASCRLKTDERLGKTYDRTTGEEAREETCGEAALNCGFVG